MFVAGDTLYAIYGVGAILMISSRLYQVDYHTLSNLYCSRHV